MVLRQLSRRLVGRLGFRRLRAQDSFLPLSRLGEGLSRIVLLVAHCDDQLLPPFRRVGAYQTGAAVEW